MPVRKPTLLCIDDDAQCLDVRRILFEAHGFDVVTSTSPTQGLRLFRLKRFDAAVIDFQMPEMNGGILAKEMKAARTDVPVIILSGLPYLPEDTPESYDRFFCKTESGFKLVKEIQDLIALPRNGGERDTALPFRKRIFVMAGFAFGYAVQGYAEVKARARRPARAFGLKSVAASHV